MLNPILLTGPGPEMIYRIEQYSTENSTQTARSELYPGLWHREAVAMPAVTPLP